MLFFIAIIFFILPTSFVYGGEFDFRKAKCGMTREEFIEKKGIIVNHDTKIAGIKAYVRHDFLHDKFSGAIYLFLEDHINGIEYLNDYFRINSLLNKKYGAGEINDIWIGHNPNTLQNNPDWQGLALLSSKLIKISAWETENMHIEHILSSKDINVSHSITYECKMFRDKIKKQNKKSAEQEEKDALDDL